MERSTRPVTSRKSAFGRLQRLNGGGRPEGRGCKTVDPWATGVFYELLRAMQSDRSDPSCMGMHMPVYSAAAAPLWPCMVKLRRGKLL